MKEIYDQVTLSAVQLAPLLERVSYVLKMEDTLELLRVASRTEQIPPENEKAHQQEMDSLSETIDSLWRSPYLEDLINTLSQRGQYNWSLEQQAELREIRQEHALRTATTYEDALALTRIENEGRAIHRDAKAANDWTLVTDHLQKVIDFERRTGTAIAQKLGRGNNPVDGRLAVWSPGLTADSVEDHFKAITPAIHTMLKEAIAYQGLRPSVPGLQADPEKIKAMNDDIVHKLGLDPQIGGEIYSKKSSVEGGRPYAAIANLVHPDPSRPFYESTKSAVHEGGHLIYLQGLPWSVTSPGQNLSILSFDRGGVMQESQALLYDMIVGRSRSFAQVLSNAAEKFLDMQITPNALYQERNSVKETIDRKNADELSYHLHVYARWKAYSELIDGSVSVADYPQRLAVLYKDIVGIEAKDPVALALQDVHVFAGKGALYPSYTIGHAIAAQLMHTIRKDIVDVDQQIGRGDFTELTGWLRTEVHQQGRKLEMDDLINQASGRRFSPAYQIEHLQARFAPGLAPGIDASPTTP